MRVVQAKQNTRDSLCRARTALRATVARPSTLMWVVGAAGVGGFWLSRQRKREAKAAAGGVATAAKTSALGLVLAFIVRYGKPALPIILRRVQAAQQQRAAQTPAAAYPPTGAHH
jgi:hypothetical protein